MRVLDAAEALFNELGYNTVTVQLIAKKLGIRAASLYYHAPGGKEELFTEVIKRSLSRHQKGIEDALADTPDDDLRAQCLAVVTWLLSRGPLGFMRLLMSDMVGLERATADELVQMAYQNLLEPIMEMFSAAQDRGEARESQPHLLAGSLLATVDGIWYASQVVGAPRTAEQMAEEYISILLDGVRPRS
jgi:AcrR family transcriptional regulator